MQNCNTTAIIKPHIVKHTVGQRTMPLSMACIAILILLRDVGEVSINRTVFICIATFACLLSNKVGIYCLLAFLTPLAPGISATYITAIVLVVLLIKQQRMKIQVGGLICMGVLLFMELLSAFRGLFSIVQYFRFVGIFAVSFLCMLDMKNEYNSEGMLHSYLFGFWVAMASMLGQMLKVYSLKQLLGLGIRLGNTRQILDLAEEGMRVSYNPNGLGALCIATTLFCLLLYRKNKKIWYLLSVCGATILGLMTQSRTFLIVYTTSIVLYGVLSCHDLKSAMKSLLAMVAGGVAVVGGAMWLIPEYIASIALRLQDADVTNGRGEIAAYYFKEMFQHIDRLLFGVGLQNYSVKYDYTMSAHNATQEVVIAWGIAGLVVVVIIFALILGNGHQRNPNAKPVQYLPFVMCLVAMQAGQGFLDTSSMLRLMVAYSAILISVSGGDTSFNGITKT